MAQELRPEVSEFEWAVRAAGSCLRAFQAVARQRYGSDVAAGVAKPEARLRRREALQTAITLHTDDMAVAAGHYLQAVKINR
jgi:hypothetical protein